MIADPTMASRVVGSVGLVLAYGVTLWRIFKSSPGDRFIECGSMTVMVFVLAMAMIRIRYFPEWVLESVEVLLYLLTSVSLFFMFRDGYLALRRRKTR